jgi:hypothetical protein
MDNRILAHDADPGTMLHDRQLIHLTTGHQGQYIAQRLQRGRDLLSELIHLCAIYAFFSLESPDNQLELVGDEYVPACSLHDLQRTLPGGFGDFSPYKV